MRVSERLELHYNGKYESEQRPTATPLVRHPRDRFEQAVFLASADAKGDLLEIGSGSGNVLLALDGLYDSVTGTELSQARVEGLKELFPDSAIFKNNIESESNIFRDESFDTILFIAVIEHLFDPIGVLKELRRMLRPGGRLIIDTPNIAKWTRRIKLAFGYFPSTASLDEGLRTYEGKRTDLHDEGHLHYFTFRSLSQIAIERCGFAKAESHGYGNLLCRLWPEMFSEISMVLRK